MPAERRAEDTGPDHLMPLYMRPELAAAISPVLKRRMPGKTCFHFKADPGPEFASGSGGAYRDRPGVPAREEPGLNAAGLARFSPGLPLRAC